MTAYTYNVDYEIQSSGCSELRNHYETALDLLDLRTETPMPRKYNQRVALLAKWAVGLEPIPPNQNFDKYYAWLTTTEFWACTMETTHEHIVRLLLELPLSPIHCVEDTGDGSWDLESIPPYARNRHYPDIVAKLTPAGWVYTDIRGIMKMYPDQWFLGWVGETEPVPVKMFPYIPPINQLVEFYGNSDLDTKIAISPSNYLKAARIKHFHQHEATLTSNALGLEPLLVALYRSVKTSGAVEDYYKVRREIDLWVSGSPTPMYGIIAEYLGEIKKSLKCEHSKFVVTQFLSKNKGDPTNTPNPIQNGILFIAVNPGVYIANNEQGFYEAIADYGKPVVAGGNPPTNYPVILSFDDRTEDHVSIKPIPLADLTLALSHIALGK